MTQRTRLALLVGGVMAIFWIVALLMPRGPSTTAAEMADAVARGSAATRADRLARASCERFRALLRDTSDGVVTPGEFRSRLKTIYDEDARHADPVKSPGIATAARRELAAVTTGTSADVTAATQAWLDACAAAPWAHDPVQ